MEATDLIGHLFYAIILAGNRFLARQSIIGWPLRFVGEFGWVAIGFYIGMTSIWTWGLIFAGYDLYGYYSWKKIQTYKLD